MHTLPPVTEPLAEDEAEAAFAMPESWHMDIHVDQAGGQHDFRNGEPKSPPPREP